MFKRSLSFTNLCCLVVVLAGLQAQAKTCNVTLTSNNKMRYSVDTIKWPNGCEQLTIQLKNQGNLAKNIMGHNLIVAAKNHMQGLVKAGAAMGPQKNYIPEDKRVLGSIPLLGPGEQGQLRLNKTAMKSGTDYIFFCSFPGHSGLMQGKLVL